MLPFTNEQFFDVFAAYNSDLPYAWAVLSLLGIAVVACLQSLSRTTRVIGITTLAVLWAWAGAVYHIAYFSTINPVAGLFGVGFLVQSVLLFASIRRLAQTTFYIKREVNGAAGLVFVFYAVLFYPILNTFSGHAFPRMPTFGLPCPLVIFTLGVFLLNGRSVPVWLIVIPLGWSIIGTSAAFVFGIWPDLALIVSAIAFLILWWKKPSAKISVIT